MLNKKLPLHLISFWLLAFVLSYAFNKLPDLINEGINARLILCGFGPFISGLICYKFFKVRNHYRITPGGARPFIVYSIVILAMILPIILSPDKQKVILVVIMQFAYSFGEEFGWRHFLQNAVRSINKWIQPFIIGSLWFFWHYSFLEDPIKSIIGQTLPLYYGIPLLILIFSAISFIWGDLTIKTKSILIPTVYHYIGKVGEPITFLIIIISLILLHVFWDKIIGKDIHPENKNKS